MSAKNVICFKCSAKVPVIGTVGFRDECYSCHSDLHCCRTCLHHDVKVYNECKENQADVVREKDRANFCEYFSPGDGQGSGIDPKGSLLSAAEALFKKK